MDINEKVLEAFNDFVEVSYEKNLNFRAQHVIDLLQENESNTYAGTMSFLYEQYGISDED